jgi:hypothetical protein
MIVILSTLNGKARLSEMLEAMLGVRIPPGTSIHIVDNGSTDGTHELLESYKDRLPLVLYTQPIPGKNHCLNLVLSQVLETMDENELVVLTDDDILPGPDWLEEMESAGRAHGDCNVFAGRVLPHWPYSDISHLDALRGHFGILFSLTNSKEGPCPPVLAWGPNMAVRAGVFQSGTRFDPAFGPNGGISFPMGSETELMERLAADGHRAWFVEKACVRHMIRASQLEHLSIVQRAFRHGYGTGWRQQRGRGGLQLVKAQCRALRGVVAARVRQLWSTDAEDLLHDFREAWARGLASGAMHGYHLSREQKKFESTFPDRRAKARDPLND